MAAPTEYRESGFRYNGVDFSVYPGYQWDYRGNPDEQGGMQYTQQAPYRQTEYNYHGWRVFQWGTYRRTPGIYRQPDIRYRGIDKDFPTDGSEEIILGLEAALSAAATVGGAAGIPVVLTPDGLIGTFTFTIPASDSGGPIKFGVVGIPGPDSSSMTVSSLLNLIDPEQLIQKPIPDVQMIVTSPSGVTLLVTTV